MIQTNWVRTKSDEAAVDAGMTFDIKAADRVRFFLAKFCKHSIGEFAGKPLELLDWQWLEFVAPLYGWLRKDGRKRFTQASVWIPKNNGKSTLCSGLSLYELVGSGEPSALVVNLAATVEQAGIIYRGAAAMVQQSMALADKLWIRKNIKTIEFEKTNSTLKIMSGDRGEGKEGHPISALFFDELSAQSDRELFDTMRHNCAKRRGAKIISISTAGYRRESIGFEQFQYAEKVLNGSLIDTSFLPVVYAAKPEDKWDDLSTFLACNPSANDSPTSLIDLESVKARIEEAKNEPRKEAAVRTFLLNQWTGYSTTWISDLAWQSCKTDFQEKDFHNQMVFVGWDYAYRHDLCSYVILAHKGDKVYLIPRFFIPKQMAQYKQERGRVPYLTWASLPETNLYLTDGDTIDPAFIREKLREDARNFRIVEVGFDEKGLEESRQIVERELGLTMVAVRQNSRSLGGAAGFFERSVLSKTLCHNGNPILDWCLSNTAAKETADGLFLFKGAGDTQRIDGVIASCIAINRFLARDIIPDGQDFIMKLW